MRSLVRPVSVSLFLLLGADAGYVTGAVLRVAGGL